MRFGVKLCSSSYSIDLPKIRRPKASRSDGKRPSDSVWKKAVELRLRLGGYWNSARLGLLLSRNTKLSPGWEQHNSQVSRRICYVIVFLSILIIC